MWYLTSDNDHRILYVVPQKSEIFLGRTPEGNDSNYFANIEDRSISRQHASLILLDDELYVKDLGSRYGTYINNSTDKLEVGQNAQLNDNDIVKFGKINWEWRVHKLTLNTCTSTLKGESIQNVRIILQKLGGLVKVEWDESCSYLTMPAITLTIKVVLALVQGSHIVTTEFWNKCLEAVNNNIKLPDPINYTPEVIESTLNKDMVSFLPNQNRRHIFINKKFVFFSKRQFEMYKQVLILTSAEPLLLSEAKLTKSRLCDRDVVVIQYNIPNISQDTQAQRSQINEIINYLNGKDKRVVAESEIGLAILYCSTEKYCNPDFNLSLGISKQPSQQKVSNILAQESQEPSNVPKTENIVINESLTSFDSNDFSASSKRKLNDGEDFQMNSNKKLAVSSTNTDIGQNNKRKLNDENTTKDNPNKKIALDENVSENQEDLFNFINPPGNELKNKENKLNLSKPMKRRADVETENDDDLFNFIQPNDKQKKPFNDTTDTNNQEEPDTIRFVKLQESINNENCNVNVSTVKKQDNELNKTMRNLNLGGTVLIINKNLIVKKEVVQTDKQNPQLPNFKKFKKVWPAYMQRN